MALDNGRVFASRYRQGVMFAPGPGCFIAPLLIIPGMSIFKSVLLAALFAIGAFVAATALWTLSRRRQPALLLTSAGMKLEGLDLKRWTEIDSVRRAPDALGRPALEVRFRHDAPRMIRSPLWRPGGPNSIVLNAMLLEDSAQAIADAFEYFLRR